MRRHPPRAPGRVVGVASETGLVLLCLPPGEPAALVAVLERLDAGAAAGKQLRFEAPVGSSLVLSLENLHDFDALRADLHEHFPELEVIEGVGAVSAIGAGINASFRNVREAVRLVEPLHVPILGIATSSFRISLLMDGAAVNEAARRLHEGLVEAPERAASEP